MDLLCFRFWRFYFYALVCDMPDSDPNELYEEFLRYKMTQGVKGVEALGVEGYPRSPKNSSMIPTELYNPDGSLNVTKALKKVSNPSVLLALIVSATNLYVEYEQMKVTVQEQKASIAVLRAEVDHYKVDSETFLEKTREQFIENERTQQELQMAISNVQTEIRIRHGVGSYVPETAGSAPSRTEQLRLLDAETESALKRASKPSTRGAPLEGLEF